MTSRDKNCKALCTLNRISFKLIATKLSLRNPLEELEFFHSLYKFKCILKVVHTLNFKRTN